MCVIERELWLFHMLNGPKPKNVNFGSSHRASSTGVCVCVRAHHFILGNRKVIPFSLPFRRSWYLPFAVFVFVNRIIGQRLYGNLPHGFVWTLQRHKIHSCPVHPNPCRMAERTNRRRKKVWVGNIWFHLSHKCVMWHSDWEQQEKRTKSNKRKSIQSQIELTTGNWQHGTQSRLESSKYIAWIFNWLWKKAFISIIYVSMWRRKTHSSNFDSLGSPRISSTWKSINGIKANETWSKLLKFYWTTNAHTSSLFIHFVNSFEKDLITRHSHAVEFANSLFLLGCVRRQSTVGLAMCACGSIWLCLCDTKYNMLSSPSIYFTVNSQPPTMTQFLLFIPRPIWMSVPIQMACGRVTKHECLYLSICCRF